MYSTYSMYSMYSIFNLFHVFHFHVFHFRADVRAETDGSQLMGIIGMLLSACLSLSLSLSGGTAGGNCKMVLLVAMVMMRCVVVQQTVSTYLLCSFMPLSLCTGGWWLVVDGQRLDGGGGNAGACVPGDAQ